jgi:hypothetical protein
MGEMSVTDLGLSCADRAAPLQAFRRRHLGFALGRLALGLRDLGLYTLALRLLDRRLGGFADGTAAWRGVASASTPRRRSSFANASCKFWRSMRFGASLVTSGPTALMLTWKCG